jgi:hypothetical protein
MDVIESSTLETKEYFSVGLTDGSIVATESHKYRA